MERELSALLQTLGWIKGKDKEGGGEWRQHYYGVWLKTRPKLQFLYSVRFSVLVSSVSVVMKKAVSFTVCTEWLFTTEDH